MPGWLVQIYVPDYKISVEARKRTVNPFAGKLDDC